VNGVDREEITVSTDWEEQVPTDLMPRGQHRRRCGSHPNVAHRAVNSPPLDCPDATDGGSHRKRGHDDIAHLGHHVHPVKIGPGKLAIENPEMPLSAALSPSMADPTVASQRRD
jgi:hypothetical protein